MDDGHKGQPKDTFLTRSLSFHFVGQKLAQASAGAQLRQSEKATNEGCNDM
jgi:hypothetical protein